MTAPINFPSASDIQDLRHAKRPFKSVAFTSGGSDLDLTDPANGLVPCATELYATSTGNLVARLAGESSDQTYAVTAAQIIQGLFTIIRGASTANAIARS
jgi:hypothetical protein